MALNPNTKPITPGVFGLVVTLVTG